MTYSNFCSGNYGEAVTVETLKDFHRRRLQVLSEAGPDIIAFETIPNKLEAQVLVATEFLCRHLVSLRRLLPVIFCRSSCKCYVEDSVLFSNALMSR